MDYVGSCSLLINSEPLGCDAVIRVRNGYQAKIKEFCKNSCNNCDDLPPPPGILYHDYSSQMAQYLTRQFHFKQLYKSTITEIWITSCSASSEFNEATSCEKAFDGKEVEEGWMTKNHESIGAWIKINLVGVYRLTKMMVMEFNDAYVAKAKDISLTFSNGEQVGFTLDDTNKWQTIDLEGIGNDIITNYVKITVNSLYPSAQYVAFSELKVFGYAPGMLYNDNVTKHHHSGIEIFLYITCCHTYMLFFSDFPENID